MLYKYTYINGIVLVLGVMFYYVPWIMDFLFIYLVVLIYEYAVAMYANNIYTRVYIYIIYINTHTYVNIGLVLQIS